MQQWKKKQEERKHEEETAEDDKNQTPAVVAPIKFQFSNKLPSRAGIGAKGRVCVAVV